MPAPTSDRAFARVRRETSDAIVDLVVDARADGAAADAVLGAAAGAERAADVLDGILAAGPLSSTPAFAIVEWPVPGAGARTRVTVHGALLAIAMPEGAAAALLVDGGAARALVERELPEAGEVLVAPRAGGTALVRLRRERAEGAEPAAVAPAAALTPAEAGATDPGDQPGVADAGAAAEDGGVLGDTLAPFTTSPDEARGPGAAPRDESEAGASVEAVTGEPPVSGDESGPDEEPASPNEETIVPPADDAPAPDDALSADDAPSPVGTAVPPLGLFAPTQLLGAIQGLLVDPARPDRPLDELAGAAPAGDAPDGTAEARPAAGAPGPDRPPAPSPSAAPAAVPSPAAPPAPRAPVGRRVDPEAPTDVLDATIVGGIVRDLRASARAVATTATAGETTADGGPERAPASETRLPPRPPTAVRPEAGPPAPPSIADRFTVIGPDGRRHEITGAAIFGRAPRAVFSASDTTLVEITDAVDISRNHVRIASEAGVIVVTDLHSRNGTDIVMPGRAPQRLRGGEPVPILEGTVVDLGSGVRLTVRR